jgi:hypothetical protein
MIWYMYVELKPIELPLALSIRIPIPESSGYGHSGLLKLDYRLSNIILSCVSVREHLYASVVTSDLVRSYCFAQTKGGDS